jgi:hypothetical protein
MERLLPFLLFQYLNKKPSASTFVIGEIGALLPFSSIIIYMPVANYGNSNSLVLHPHSYDMRHKIDLHNFSMDLSDISGKYQDLFQTIFLDYLHIPFGPFLPLHPSTLAVTAYDWLASIPATLHIAYPLGVIYLVYLD